MPPEITRLADQFLSAPVRIEVARPASTASTIEQKIVTLSSTDPKLKREALRRVIRSQTVSNGIIFCNRKVDVDIVWKSLTKHGFSVAALHGDLPQNVRTATLDKFRAGEVQLLVASDVAARGLDIPAVSHVFNFDVPIHADDYVHRIGRTGRAGRQGHAFMLAGPKDAKFVDAIEALTKKTIDRDDMTDLHVEPDTRQRGGRDRDQGRGDRQRGGRERDRGRGRHREDRPRHDRVASTEPFDSSLAVVTPVEDVVPAAPEASAEQRSERQARPRNERRRDRERDRPEGAKPPREREAHDRKERDRPAPQREKQAPRERSRRDSGGDDGPAASFSDNVPAFLARPVPQHLLRRKKEGEVA
jgi:superfamily II DNA/RNA helicase